MDIKEFEIPVPWGHIAAKTWGSEKNTPVLLMHGISDNIGSFECLIPYLREDFYYICIDLPGHGKSSRFSPYLPVTLVNFILTIILIADYLKRDKYVLIGHSWSGHTAIMFTLLYPERVSKLILLDVIFPYPLSVDYFKHFIRDRIDYLSKMNKKRSSNPSPSYTYNQAFKRIQKNRMYGEATNEATKALTERSLIPLKNGKFQFSSDFRLKLFYNTLFGKEFTTELIKQYPVMCPVLFVIANNSIPSAQYFRSFLKELWKHNNQCFLRTLDGNHDVHMNNPKIVAPIINAFLVYKSSKL
ncbi:hypothetical protein ILUMI_00476 [Ignelater luminosus]|uniref:AB hydrolase-1 domain-containing protein n=1 Tax=Ignelater luminosus TaxID=2038154 RepID=A0A8K0DLT6_IGNLU|nr:hypothetical protein ILUMI_00476 [Ignelater luminosus]